MTAHALLLASSFLLVAANARAQDLQVPVTVVDLAGDRAYVSPGSSAGIAAGDEVVIAERRYPVVGSTASFAAIDPTGGPPAPGATGIAIVRPRAATETSARSEPPPSLEAFRGQWRDAVRPASGQAVEAVPLGGADDRRFRATVSLIAGALVPLDDASRTFGSGALRAQVHAEPFRDFPLALDADVAGQLYLARGISARAGNGSRPYLRVRELRAALGHEGGLYAALGRLRYAASGLGELDGVRVQSPAFHGFTAAAFGGFVPDPTDGRPAIDASRFGIELGYRALQHDLRPTASLVALGSVFDGQIDERRLLAAFSMFPERGSVGAHAELALHDGTNPWSAPRVELEAIGASGRARFGRASIGARVDMRRPERSLWLAAYLPPGWLCRAAENDPAGCVIDDDPRYQASLDAGLSLDAAELATGVTALRTGDLRGIDHVAAFAQVRFPRVGERFRLTGTASTATGTFYDSHALAIEAGLMLAGGHLDLSLRYRPAISRYQSEGRWFAEHGAGATLVATPRPCFDVVLDADVLAGDGVPALLVQTALTWRPRLRGEAEEGVEHGADHHPVPPVRGR